MRMIVKGKEPKSLTQHRLQPHSNYNNYSEKDDLRIALTREQKGLCCYCTNRIRPESKKMKIEHCDTSKGNQRLTWNPANVDHRIEDRIRFLNDGTIEGVSDEFDFQLNEILNLNVKRLMRNRKVVYEEVLKWWRSTPNARLRVQDEINKRTGDVDDYTPFSPVAVWFLRQKL